MPNFDRASRAADAFARRQTKTLPAEPVGEAMIVTGLALLQALHGRGYGVIWLRQLADVMESADGN